MTKYKVAVIGGGPGGYVTAIRLQQYGLKVGLFEKERLGGVCLNHGCIPTKSLVKVAELYSEIKKADNYGINSKAINIDYEKILQRKNDIVEKLVSGVEFIFKKRNIPVMNEKVVKIIKTESGYEIKTEKANYESEYIIIATGSKPKELPNVKCDGKNILSSKQLLAMNELPKKLVVIGGGVIGCEFASIYNQLGVEVEIIEFFPSLIANEDAEISRRLAMFMKKSGIKIHLKTALKHYEETENGLLLTLSNGKKLDTTKLLLSVGRDPIVDIDFIDCELTRENGFIAIDEMMRTNLDNIFAIGDVVGKSMLAHTASKQGLIVADMIYNGQENKNKNFELDYNKIPACTFTNPEIASVGDTQEEAEEKFKDILIGKFPFNANGKALSLGAIDGFVKVVALKKTGKILGVHIIGHQATELIAQAGILLGLNADYEDVSKVIFAHPTLSETVMEAFEDLQKLAIHKL
ncbi:MAG: dihydrolipoyl dehydrogenase [Candidatus Cloacimonetes bacterium]|nr:dihydrolipoyl dehydrogenase [Candidatus Cloacimonadota bacterium]